MENKNLHKQLYKYTIKELTEKFAGRWVSVHELDSFFFKNGYGCGIEFGDNLDIGLHNKSWSYENPDVCGYCIKFKQHRKDEQGLTEVYLTKKSIALL